MGRPKRRSRNTAALYDPKALAANLPDHVSNANGCMRWASADEYQRAVAHYLRTVGVTEQLAPTVAAANGGSFCILLRNRVLFLVIGKSLGLWSPGGFLLRSTSQRTRSTPGR